MVAQHETRPASVTLPAWLTDALGVGPSPQPPGRALIAHPQTFTRQTIRLLLEALEGAEIVAEVADGTAAVAACVELRPAVALVAAELPALGGAETVRAIARQAPDVRMLVLGDRLTATAALRAVEAGALGYLPASAALSDLVLAYRAAQRGESYFTPDLARLLVQTYLPRRQRRGPAALSPRELEILDLLAAGEPNRRIAAELRLSVKTVEAHKANMVKKLGLRNTLELVRYALASGEGRHRLSRAS
jgi:DNA-binding NarL/FixJ family response regulator